MATKPSPALAAAIARARQEAQEDADALKAMDNPNSAGELLDVAGTAGLGAVTGNWADEVAAEASDLSDEESRLMRMDLDAKRNRTKSTAVAGLAGDIVGSLALPVVKTGKAGLAALGAISGAGAGEDPESRVWGAALSALLGLVPGAGKVIVNKIRGKAAAKKEAEALVKEFTKSNVATPEGTIAEPTLKDKIKSVFGSPKPPAPVEEARLANAFEGDDLVAPVEVAAAPAPAVQGARVAIPQPDLDVAVAPDPDAAALRRLLEEINGPARNPVLAQAEKMADELIALRRGNTTPAARRALVERYVRQILEERRAPGAPAPRPLDEGADFEEFLRKEGAPEIEKFADARAAGDPLEGYKPTVEPNPAELERLRNQQAIDYYFSKSPEGPTGRNLFQPEDLEIMKQMGVKPTSGVPVGKGDFGSVWEVTDGRGMKKGLKRIDSDSPIEAEFDGVLYTSPGEFGMREIIEKQRPYMSPAANDAVIMSEGIMDLGADKAKAVLMPFVKPLHNAADMKSVFQRMNVANREGTLRELMTEPEFAVLPDNVKYLAKGLADLRDQGFITGDISAKNVMVDFNRPKESNLTIADIGAWLLKSE